jgi:hypothetical protein
MTYHSPNNISLVRSGPALRRSRRQRLGRCPSACARRCCRSILSSTSDPFAERCDYAANRPTAPRIVLQVGPPRNRGLRYPRDPDSLRDGDRRVLRALARAVVAEPGLGRARARAARAPGQPRHCNLRFRGRPSPPPGRKASLDPCLGRSGRYRGESACRDTQGLSSRTGA